MSCEADMEKFVPGNKVLLHSLKQANLNGQHGILDKFDVASQRWGVKLNDRLVRVRRQNICCGNEITHQAQHDRHDRPPVGSSSTLQDLPQEETPWDDDKITILLQLLSGDVHDLRMETSCRLSDLRKVVAEKVGSPWSSRAWKLIGSHGIFDAGQDCLTLLDAGIVDGTSITAVHARSLCGFWLSSSASMRVHFSTADEGKIKVRILNTHFVDFHGEILEEDSHSFSVIMRPPPSRALGGRAPRIFEGELSRDGRAISGTFQGSRIILKKETS